MIPSNIEKILNLARWAPSGDNTQPWRFEVIDDMNFIIHAWDTRDWCVYDLDGRASQIAIGALIETIRVAASAQGLGAEFRSRMSTEESRLTVDVKLNLDSGIEKSPLVDAVEKRVTNRRPFTTKSLTAAAKASLEESVGPNHTVTWLEGGKNRRQMGLLLSRSAKIRLTIPEAYEVHKRIIQWDSRFSEDKIPDQAVGLDVVGLKLMRWAMGSWQRVDFLNSYLGGTWLPRLQLDLMPGIMCGAHFLISSNRAMDATDDFLEGGAAMQRFWLTAAQLDLQFQPEMTPLIFSRYVKNNVAFSASVEAQRSARKVASDLSTLFKVDTVSANGVFMGRVGYASSPRARSTRLDLQSLLKEPT